MASHGSTYEAIQYGFVCRPYAGESEITFVKGILSALEKLSVSLSAPQAVEDPKLHRLDVMLAALIGDISCLRDYTECFHALTDLATIDRLDLKEPAFCFFVECSSRCEVLQLMVRPSDKIQSAQVPVDAILSKYRNVAAPIPNRAVKPFVQDVHRFWNNRGTFEPFTMLTPLPVDPERCLFAALKHLHSSRFSFHLFRWPSNLHEPAETQTTVHEIDIHFVSRYRHMDQERFTLRRLRQWSATIHGWDLAYIGNKDARRSTSIFVCRQADGQIMAHGILYGRSHSEGIRLEYISGCEGRAATSQLCLSVMKRIMCAFVGGEYGESVKLNISSLPKHPNSASRFAPIKAARTYTNQIATSRLERDRLCANPSSHRIQSDAFYESTAKLW